MITLARIADTATHKDIVPVLSMALYLIALIYLLYWGIQLFIYIVNEIQRHRK